MIKGSFHQEDIITINIYALNIRKFKCINKTLNELKAEIEGIVIIEDF